MEILGLIGIVVALALFMFLVYKGCASYWAVIISVIVVALTNRIGLVEAITGHMLGGMVDLILTLFSVVFLGAIFGKVYTDTGAAASIANTLLKAFVDKREGKKKVAAAIVVLMVVAALCTVGGIDGYVMVFTIFPICMIVAESCDIPRRFVPGILCLNVAFMTMPGSPQIYNIMAEAALKSQIQGFVEKEAFGIVDELAAVSSTSAAIPGIISTIFIAVGCCIILIRMINKAMANGEHFDRGTVPAIPGDAPDQKRPHVIVAILPLVLVFVLFSIVKLDIFLSLSCGILLALITMFKYLPPVDARGNTLSLVGRFVRTLNDGSNGYPSALINLVTPTGLATVITSTAAFGIVIGMLSGMQVAPTLLLIIFVCVIVALTSSPPAALMVAVPAFLGVITGPALAQAAVAATVHLPISAHAVFRISALAASTFETLPINGLVLLCLNLSHCTHKEGYKPMFMMTVLMTLLGTILCALLCLIPGLA